MFYSMYCGGTKDAGPSSTQSVTGACQCIGR